MSSYDHKAVLARRFRFLPDRIFAILVHALYQRELTTLTEPKTFTQLLAARNASGVDPLVTITADKYTARDYIAKRVGEEHLVPLQYVIESIEDLDFDALTLPCAIKATHGYDMNMFLRGDEALNKEKVRRTVYRWLNTNFYENWKERSYLGLKPRCIVEEFLGDGVNPPADFKFYVFNGRVGMIQVDEDRFVDHRINMFDGDFNLLTAVGIYPSPPKVPSRPDNLDEMIKIAEVLADEFEFARIDTYLVDGRVYVGEITHYPGGGVLRWQPDGFDLALGELWRNGTPIPNRFLAAVVD